jgi:hypothetical protein
MTRRCLLQGFSLAAAGAAPNPLVAFEAPPAGGASDRLLDEIQRRACLFFYEMADPATGMVLDRAPCNGGYEPGVSSIAATGFGLSALAIAHRRGYLDPDAAQSRVRQTLEFLCEKAERKRGFFYHFLDSSNGKRVWNCEASSIDTCWLLCGALHCRAYWDDATIRSRANELLNRADWTWMLNGSRTLSHGWTPEGGFLSYRWDTYAELLAMYLLAMASETHGIPASCWHAWKRPMRNYRGVFYMDAETPLFVHQYSHAWFDFRGRVDSYANYFNNSQRATQAHRNFCIHLSSEFPWYGPDMWGVTASDSRGGYRVWGHPARPPDGTLVPCAAGGSIVFLPQSCGSVLQNMYDRYGDQAWRKYGFVDAFHPQERWFNADVVAIDQGIMLLMAENYRSLSVWDAVMSTPEARRGFEAAGLKLAAA